MSNHVHLLIATTIQLDAKHEETDLLCSYVQLDTIMKLIKGATSRYANKTLGTSGQFWERENFDVLVRNA
jgi:hypothetical protein